MTGVVEDRFMREKERITWPAGQAIPPQPGDGSAAMRMDRDESFEEEWRRTSVSSFLEVDWAGAMPESQ